MNTLPIKANIHEIDGGAFYPVRLVAIPRIGELIGLDSFIDRAAGSPPETYQYEVVQIRHDIHDTPQAPPRRAEGHHFVTIFVRRVDNQFFES
jgi:hypothetical protein